MSREHPEAWADKMDRSKRCALTARPIGSLRSRLLKQPNAQSALQQREWGAQRLGVFGPAMEFARKDGFRLWRESRCWRSRADSADRPQTPSVDFPTRGGA